MADFISILKPLRADMLLTGPTPQEAETIGRHFAYLQELCRRGSVVLAGRTTTEDEHTFGVVIFKAESAHAANELVLADPAVAGKVMSATLTPFRIALLAANTGVPPAAGA